MPKRKANGWARIRDVVMFEDLRSALQSALPYVEHAEKDFSRKLTNDADSHLLACEIRTLLRDIDALAKGA